MNSPLENGLTISPVSDMGCLKPDVREQIVDFERDLWATEYGEYLSCSAAPCPGMRSKADVYGTDRSDRSLTDLEHCYPEARHAKCPECGAGMAMRWDRDTLLELATARHESNAFGAILLDGSGRLCGVSDLYVAEVGQVWTWEFESIYGASADFVARFNLLRSSGGRPLNPGENQVVAWPLFGIKPEYRSTSGLFFRLMGASIRAAPKWATDLPMVGEVAGRNMLAEMNEQLGGFELLAHPEQPERRILMQRSMRRVQDLVVNPAAILAPGA